jgi:hypothetical protein
VGVGSVVHSVGGVVHVFDMTVRDGVLERRDRGLRGRSGSSVKKSAARVWSVVQAADQAAQSIVRAVKCARSVVRAAHQAAGSVVQAVNDKVCVQAAE